MEKNKFNLVSTIVSVVMLAFSLLAYFLPMATYTDPHFGNVTKFSSCDIFLFTLGVDNNKTAIISRLFKNNSNLFISYTVVSVIFVVFILTLAILLIASLNDTKLNNIYVCTAFFVFYIVMLVLSIILINSTKVSDGTRIIANFNFYPLFYISSVTSFVPPILNIFKMYK